MIIPSKFLNEAIQYNKAHNDFIRSFLKSLHKRKNSSKCKDD